MATNDVSYNYKTVNAGDSGSADKPETEGDNNTLAKMSAIEGIDVKILSALNPYIPRTTTIIPPGKQVLVQVGSMTGDIDDFKTATLRVGIRSSKGYPITITKSDGTENTIYCDPNAKNPARPNLSLETISQNSKDWFGTSIKVDTLLKLNKYWVVTQSELIPPMQTVLVEVCVPGSSTLAKISACGIRVNSTRTCYIKWDWDHEVNSTSGMEVWWRWKSSDNQIWEGSRTTITDLEVFESTYSPDDAAVEVMVCIRPKEKSALSTSVPSATSTKYSWSNEQSIYFHDNWSVITPSAPNVEIKKYKLTATYESLPITETPITEYNEQTGKFEVVGYDRDITHVQFKVIEDENEQAINTVETMYEVGVGGYVQYSCTIAAGHKYRVCARCCKKMNSGAIYYSSWSVLSNPINSLPIAPILYECNVMSDNVAQFNWQKINSAEGYILQYLVKDNNVIKNYSSIIEYFNNNEQSAEEFNVDSYSALEDNNRIVYRHGVEDGDYLVRVKSINDTADSDWSNIVELIIGELPDAPTTWSSTTTVSVGEPLTLYWIHNSKDNSVETKAEIEMVVDGVKSRPIYVTKPTEEDKRDETSHYKIDTEEFQNGSKVEWRVRTAGVFKDKNNKNNPDGYGEWSIKRTVEIYAPPTLSVSLLNYNKEPLSNKLTTLPLYVRLETGNTTNQKPTGYYINVIARDGYSTIDEVGNSKAVMKGSSVFSKYYDKTDVSIIEELSAKDLTLENNQYYTVVCTVSMSSGLIAETTSQEFRVAWLAQGYEPNAEIGIDMKTLTARIRPFAAGAGKSVNLFVYRREFDGTFTEILTGDENTEESGLENETATWVTDPHPALDYARYRIVSRSKDTGLINYFDVPSFPVQEKSVVIQWDEKWQSFDALDGDTAMANADKSYNGSILKLPYNIDVSNTHSPDVSLVRYTGRKRPVSYYGTQLGESATWNVEIPKSDKETLYALRRLSVYMGNVYVREPSGSGYWASLSISFSQTHLGLTIPVTLNITPVEGGM